MASAGVALLAEGSRAHLIEVRLIRKWRPRPKSYDTFYIFLDKQNDAIQAFSAGKDQAVTVSKLQPSQCYHIKGYACTGLDKNNRVIANPVCIRMGAATNIVSIPDVSEIPHNFFSIGDYNDIQDMYMGHEKIIDYTGVLQAIEDGKTKRSSKPYVNLKLTDSSNETIYITLWEEIANMFDRFPRITIQKAAKPTVIVATSLKFNKYTGRLDLQSTTATYVYLNPDHPEKDNLLKSYDPNLVQANTQLSLLASNAEKITISELLMIHQPQPPEKAFMCESFISEFITKEGWYYTGCLNCKGTAHKSGEFWFCTDCGDINDISYKSRIVVLISEGLSQLKVAMFDDTLSILIDKPIQNIIIKDGYDDNSCLPEPITKTRGERRIFVLKPQREQYAYTPKFIVKEILPLDFLTKQLHLEGPTEPTTPTTTTAQPTQQITPTHTQPPATPLNKFQTTPSTGDSTTKRKIKFESKGTSSPIRINKQHRYKK